MKTLLARLRREQPIGLPAALTGLVISAIAAWIGIALKSYAIAILAVACAIVFFSLALAHAKISTVPWPSEETQQKIAYAVEKTFTKLLLLIFLALGVYAAYKGLEHYGWITHDRELPVLINGNWMTGEYRDCYLSAQASALGCKTDDYVTGSWHKLPVSFRTTPEATTETTWHCQREEKSLDCKPI